MYPLPAVIVNNSETPLEPLRAALLDNAVALVGEHKSTDVMLSQWPSPPDATKRMLVVRLRSLEDVTQMSRLEACFPGWPLLAIVEGDVDASGLLQVSRAGAAQIVLYPFTRPDFDAALDRLLLQFGLRQSACKVVAISSVMEGSGATSLAINLAAELAAIGEVPVVLTELSMGIGRLASRLNLSPITTVRDLVSDTTEPNTDTVQASLVHVNKYLSVLAEQTHSLEQYIPKLDRLQRLGRILRQVSSFIVVDLPNTFDPN